MMCTIAENRVPEWRAMLSVCKNSRNKRILDVSIRLFRLFRILLKLRRNYVIIRHEDFRSVQNNVNGK